MPESDDTADAVEAFGRVFASIPAMLGYHPTNAMVALFRLADARQFSIAAMDIDPDHDAPDVARFMARVGAQGRVNITLFVIAPGEVTDPPHEPIVDMVHLECFTRGHDLIAAAWAGAIQQGQPWASYRTGLHGVLPDPRTTPLAALLAAQGQHAYRSRVDLAATLAPDPVDQLDRRRAAIAATARTPRSVEDSLALIETTTAAFLDDSTNLYDAVVVQLVHTFADIALQRTFLLGLDSATASRTNPFWVRLVQALPDAARSFPATVLSLGNYLAGHGVIASIAAQIAVNADPGNGFATAVDTGVRYGASAGEIHFMLSRAYGRPRT
ncbi:DUF4192 domain-containing protein [Actinokineospora sp. HUAS TT18]|uniref:DUF4192 domain-containing protein n=1 Tax=Actinokineospora sp. HUAS TT18 TaxID=3447451 RepID=UPI003F52403E